MAERNIVHRWLITVDDIELEVTIDTDDDMRVNLKSDLAPGEKIRIGVE